MLRPSWEILAFSDAPRVDIDPKSLSLTAVETEDIGPTPGSVDSPSTRSGLRTFGRLVWPGAIRYVAASLGPVQNFVSGFRWEAIDRGLGAVCHLLLPGLDVCDQVAVVLDEGGGEVLHGAQQELPQLITERMFCRSRELRWSTSTTSGTSGRWWNEWSFARSFDR
jgi:hypothetical protein